jgi:hypothetical protein
MAMIPMGQGRRVMPGRAPQPQSTAQEFGVASARALEQFGAEVAGTGMDLLAQQTRQQQQALREQQALQEASERQRELLALQQTEDQMRDAHDEVATAIQNGTIPKDKAESAWGERVTKITGDASGQFRDQTKPLADRSLQGLGLRLGNSIRKTTEAKTRSDIGAGMGQSLELMARQYRTDPAKATEQAIAALQTFGPQAGMNPEQIQKATQGWLEQTQFTAGFEAVSAGRDDPQKLREAIKVVNALPNLDPQKRATLLDRAQAYDIAQGQKREQRAAAAQRETERRMRNAEAEFQTFQGLVDKGGALSPEYIDRVSLATAGTPYQAGIVELARQARETGGIAAQPVQVQRQLLNAIDNEIASKGRSPELDKRRQQVAKVVDGSEADLKKDPLRAGLERGVIEGLQPLNLQGGIGGIVQQLTQRVQQAGRVQQWAGRPVSPFTSDEAEHVGDMLSKLPLEQRASAVANLTRAMPPQSAQALAKQIDSKDRALSIAMAFGTAQTTEGRYTSQLVMAGADAIKNRTVKDDRTAETGLMAQVNKELGGLYLNPQQTEMAADAARYIVAGKQAMGERMGVPAAVRLAIGGTKAEVNGAPIVLPAGVEASAFERHIEQYPAEALARQLPDGKVYVRGQATELAPFLANLPQAQLQTVGRGRYAIKAAGSFVSNAKGDPIVIEAPNAR